MNSKRYATFILVMGLLILFTGCFLKFKQGDEFGMNLVIIGATLMLASVILLFRK